MLLNRQEFLSYKEKAAKAYEMQQRKIIVCCGTGCVAGGSLDVYAKLKELMEAQGINVEVTLESEPHSDNVGLKKSGCHGFCEMGPLVRIEPHGWLYTKVHVED